MSITRQVAAVLVLMTTGLLSGCLLTPPEPTADAFIVTISVQNFSDPPLRRNTYGQDRWQAPLRTRQVVRKLAQDHQLTAIDAWPIPALGLHCVLFESLPGTNLNVVFNALKREPGVHNVQRNHSFNTMTVPGDTYDTYDDPLFSVQYGVHAAAVKRLHETTLGERVVVGVIDSNVDLTHPDLAGQVAQHQSLVTAKNTADQLHGTAMAGIISAVADNGEGVVGIAPAARLNVYGACRQSHDRTLCRTFAIAKAISHAIDDRVDVLNISLAGPADPLLDQLLQMAAHKHSMVIVAAANPSQANRNFPASLEFVHAPGQNGPPWFIRQEQMSTQAGGGYQVFYGTSVASAGVSGVAALLRSISSPDATNQLLGLLLQDGCSGPPARELATQLQLSDLCD